MYIILTTFSKWKHKALKCQVWKKQKKNIIRDDLHDQSQAFTYYFIKGVNSKIRMVTQAWTENQKN